MEAANTGVSIGEEILSPYALADLVSENTARDAMVKSIEWIGETLHKNAYSKLPLFIIERRAFLGGEDNFHF